MQWKLQLCRQLQLVPEHERGIGVTATTANSSLPRACPLWCNQPYMAVQTLRQTFPMQTDRPNHTFEVRQTEGGEKLPQRQKRGLTVHVVVQVFLEFCFLWVTKCATQQLPIYITLSELPERKDFPKLWPRSRQHGVQRLSQSTKSQLQ